MRALIHLTLCAAVVPAWAQPPERIPVPRDVIVAVAECQRAEIRAHTLLDVRRRLLDVRDTATTRDRVLEQKRAVRDLAACTPLIDAAGGVPGVSYYPDLFTSELVPVEEHTP